jgi:diguanylate cyclase (GGDEF)-like protein/PAS domain S-box-containing protein
MQETHYGKDDQRFIGLRWKSFLWLSLLLLCICATFYVLNYHALMLQYKDRQQAEINSLQQHIKGIFMGTSDRLIRLGGALAAMPELGKALKVRNAKQISTIVSDYTNFGYDLDLRRIDLYTRDTTIAGHWAQFEAEELPQEFYRNAIENVQRNEKPISLLYCHPLCLIYAFVPILTDGENVGVIALGQSIADFIIDFKLVTGADIALAIPVNNKTDTDGNEKSKLLSWNVKIPALTDAVKLMPLLDNLSRHYPDPALLDKGHLANWNGTSYDVYRISLNQIISGENGFILLFSDVSQRLRSIKNALQQGLLVTISSLIVAELILLYLIHVPLQRLSRLALSLPLLAEGAYEQARTHFASPRKKVKSRDEIDFLYESADRLSYQLEENNLSLAIKNQELAEERDFIRGLLASAQVLVLTQTKQGIIRIGNDFATQLIGYNSEQLCGQRFIDLIADTGAKDDLETKLHVLCNNGQRRMEHEHEVICNGGELRKIVWIHTALHEEYSDGSAILSVGLDVTERVRAESKMRWLANHDPLTTLFNRHRFIEKLNRIYDEVSYSGDTAALLVFDLDHFKEINDTSGHAAGDALLRMVAEEMKSRARSSDIIARLGGDEFAMIMPHTNNYGAETFARRLNERFTAAPFVYGDKRYRIGASIGIAFLPEHGRTPQEVMSNADIAMFEAKRTGRSRAQVFSYEQQHTQALTQNVYWKDILTQAMENGQLFFYFQPIIHTKTEKIAYFEALLRLKMDDGRVVPPGEFLPAIGRSGLNYALDCYVVRTALKILLAKPDKRLSINLSTAALDDASWTEPLVHAVNQQHLDPGRLIFEITETAIIADMEKAKQIAQQVTALGFCFAVDDFGAGFSSLYYLKHLPVDCVKIDQSLIRDIISDSEDCDFVRAIVSMIHVYGKKVVVEGIENSSTFNLLKEMNVDFVQGYYIGHPVAEEGLIPP